ncbi:alpha/beta fold hydrolase [Pseudonocardia thermophila]|uniref:alpha/beta fold hydrolase n=1 Tax=Pseudonocardia thermophila TaxID=1848 RepID=UPI0009371126|nr:alpha/beta hydrolase [Pseudonocardia thermophila]
MPLNVVTFGPASGRPVFALHGVTGHAQRWKVLAAALPDLRWHAVDLRGHGHSPWPPPWSIEQHVADALAVLDSLGLDRTAVVGHSFGGAIALHLARTAPERVERLVLLDPALGLDPQDMLESAENTRADESFPDRAAARAAKVEAWGPGVPDELVDAELDAHLHEDGGRWRYRFCRSAVVTAWSEMARPAVVPPPGIPTLIVPAKHADYVSPDWLADCRAAAGDALTVVEVDSGHMVHLERTAEVAAAVGPFLAA